MVKRFVYGFLLLMMLFAIASAQNNGPLVQLIQDPGFEASAPNGSNAFWTSTSTNFGTAICGTSCGGSSANGALPHVGTYWVWFGAATTAETATVSQTVTLPASGPLTLSFWLWIGRAGLSGDVMNVQVDGTTAQTYFTPPGPESAYTQRFLNLGAYANGAPHTIRFQYVHTGGSAFSNFNVDDIQINTTATPTGTIAGRVLRVGGRPITHAKITISGGGLPAPLIFYTDRDGNYSSSELTVGPVYSVSVSQRRFTFNPSDVGVTLSGTGITTRNFTGSP